ncbi:unnamed protein product [Auanema sp. JU1783]|nr:unnamed protein product [Auanema sp. JU1783]
MRPPRGGGPNHVGPVIPATTNLPFPQCALDALAQVSKHVRLAGPARKRTLAPQYAEWQPLIDNDIFCLTNDRTTTRLSSLQQFALLRVLAQFFTEKSEDSSKNAYFEAIFLGRQGDTILHEYRIQVLFRLASFALQVPVLHLYMPISQWLSKESTSRAYAEVFIKMLVEHFIFPAYDKQLYQFLLPLDLKCPEFTVFFITYAPKFADMTSPMVVVCGDYFVKNNNYILNQFRDSTSLAREFVKFAFPKYLTYLVNEQNVIPATVNLNMGVSELLRKWHTKVRDVQLDTSYLWNPIAPWTKTRSDYLLAELGRNQSRREIVAENLLPLITHMPSNFEKAKELRDAATKIELIRKQKRSRNHAKEKTDEMMDIDLVDDTGDLSTKKQNHDERSNSAKRPNIRSKKVAEPYRKGTSPNKIGKHTKSEPTKKSVAVNRVIPSPASPDAEIPPAASPQAEIPMSNQREIPPPASPQDELPPAASPVAEIPPPASPVDEIPPPASPAAEIPPPASPPAEIPPPASPQDELPPAASPVADIPPPASPVAEIPPPASPVAEIPPSAPLVEIPPPASPQEELPPPASPEAEVPPPASPPAELPPPASPDAEVPPPASPEPDIPPPSSPVHMEPSPLKQKVIPM